MYQYLVCVCTYDALILYMYFFAGANKGILNLLITRNNQAKPVVPAVDKTVTVYKNNGGCLSLLSNFGRDPLAEILWQRDRTYLLSFKIEGKIFKFYIARY